MKGNCNASLVYDALGSDTGQQTLPAFLHGTDIVSLILGEAAHFSDFRLLPSSFILGEIMLGCPERSMTGHHRCKDERAVGTRP